MAVGCPVVVSSQVALHGLVRSAGAGVTVEREPADIARAVATILSDPVAAAAMGEAGRRAIDDKLSWREVAVQLEALYRSVAAGGARRTRSAVTAPRSPASTDLSAIPFVCPVCRAALERDEIRYWCASCDRAYPIIDGIPLLAPASSRTEEDEIGHHHGRRRRQDAHKAAQEEHFDLAVAEEFEITRPHGTPRLYRFLLGEKFRRATGPIGPALESATALTVCGGSGLDAEYLVRSGARVVASDLSIGAARRTRERARRYGLEIVAIVADIERLPFADEAFDLVLVHDGLHHLQRPEQGLTEMARVARRWVSVNEPAHAVVTSLAVRAGLALEQEEAGNRVERFRLRDIVPSLRTSGFRPVLAQRYAMYYPHTPGPISRALSGRGIFPLVRLAWTVTNAIVGRAGNKLVVVAARDRPSATDGPGGG